MPTLLLIDETGQRAAADARKIERNVAGLRVRIAHSMAEGAALAACNRPDLALVYTTPSTEPARLREEVARLPARLGSVVLGDTLPEEARLQSSLLVRTRDLGWLAELAEATSSLPPKRPDFDRHGAINLLAALLSGLRAMEVALKAETTPATADSLGRHLAPLLEATRQLSAAVCAHPGEELSR